MTFSLELNSKGHYEGQYHLNNMSRWEGMIFKRRSQKSTVQCEQSAKGPASDWPILDYLRLLTQLEASNGRVVAELVWKK